jgi:hypothetical protein
MTEFNFSPVPSGVVKPQGRTYDYFNKLAVSWTSFGGGNNGNPDAFITFSTKEVQMINLTVDGYVPAAGGTSPYVGNVIEYSFNGTTVSGELGSGIHNASMTWRDRVVGLIWFRVQNGSSGTINVSVQAFAIR